MSWYKLQELGPLSVIAVLHRNLRELPQPIRRRHRIHHRLEQRSRRPVIAIHQLEMLDVRKAIREETRGRARRDGELAGNVDLEYPEVQIVVERQLERREKRPAQGEFQPGERRRVATGGKKTVHQPRDVARDVSANAGSCKVVEVDAYAGKGGHCKNRYDLGKISRVEIARYFAVQVEVQTAKVLKHDFDLPSRLELGSET